MSVWFQLRLELVWKNYFIPFNWPSLSAIITLLWSQCALICANQHPQYYIDKNPANFWGPFHSTWHQCYLSVHLHSLLFIAAANVPCKRPLGSRRGAELSCFWDSIWTIGRNQFTYLGRGKDAESTVRGWATFVWGGQDSCISKPSTMDRVTEQNRHIHGATTTKCLHEDLLAQQWQGSRTHHT